MSIRRLKQNWIQKHETRTQLLRPHHWTGLLLRAQWRIMLCDLPREARRGGEGQAKKMIVDLYHAMRWPTDKELQQELQRRVPADFQAKHTVAPGQPETAVAVQARANLLRRMELLQEGTRIERLRGERFGGRWDQF